MRCWGTNPSGEMGPKSADTWGIYGNYLYGLTPPTNDGLVGVRAIATGYDHTCALTSTGGVRCWGYNDFGQLGKVTTMVLTPAQVIGTCD